MGDRSVMFYHASKIGGINVLLPNVSNHQKPYLYFSTKRDNVLVYLSNAVEKHCKENGFVHDGKWHTWASYGFDADGILRLDEYYHDALRDTYQGVAGYIYSVCFEIENAIDIRIPDAFAVDCPVNVNGFEYIEDAYSEILKAEKRGTVRIRRYEDMDAEMLAWIKRTIKKEYISAENEPDYRMFLNAKFDFINAE